MPKVSRYEHYGESYGFDCPGCGHTHIVPVTGDRAWGFNRDLERPTFTPSLLMKYNYVEGNHTSVCHSFVREGNIEFLSDCTHPLAGKTVALSEIKDS